MHAGQNLTVFQIDPEGGDTIVVDEDGEKFQIYNTTTRYMARIACRTLCDTIEATGGICRNHKGETTCVGDESWVDLASAYKDACKALGREPMWGEDETDVEDVYEDEE